MTPHQQQIQIRPEDVPAVVAQHKAQKEAFEKVTAIKRECIIHLEEMAAQSWLACTDHQGHTLDGLDEDTSISQIAHALHSMAKVQLLEYTLQLAGLEEKLAEISRVLDQLDSPILQASITPAVPPGFRGFKAPKLS